MNAGKEDEELMLLDGLFSEISGIGSQMRKTHWVSSSAVPVVFVLW
jgi:hypothetical protein